jgi:hypothetical protein
VLQTPMWHQACRTVLSVAYVDMPCVAPVWKLFIDCGSPWATVYEGVHVWSYDLMTGRTPQLSVSADKLCVRHFPIHRTQLACLPSAASIASPTVLSFVLTDCSPSVMWGDGVQCINCALDWH